jgi:RimJ/RimL family protein N-acetyltransferase
MNQQSHDLEVLQTTNLELIPHTPEHLRAALAGATTYADSIGYGVVAEVAEVYAQASPEFIARIQNAVTRDPWWDGYGIVLKAENMVIGACGFKGAPGSDGAVEIAYGLASTYRCKGYATEAAKALVKHAFSHTEISLVLAHTMPEPNASTKVLQKCGFRHLGEVMDPEDGRVWRWEIRR